MPFITRRIRAAATKILSAIGSKSSPNFDSSLKILAKRIIYVSCNTATQARDLALLKEKYNIKEIQSVDMFPHTHHVENILSLDLR